MGAVPGGLPKGTTPPSFAEVCFHSCSQWSVDSQTENRLLEVRRCAGTNGGVSRQAHTEAVASVRVAW